MVDAMFAEVREQNADVLVEGVSSQQEALYDYTHYFGAERSVAKRVAQMVYDAIRGE